MVMAMFLSPRMPIIPLKETSQEAGSADLETIMEIAVDPPIKTTGSRMGSRENPRLGSSDSSRLAMLFNSSSVSLRRFRSAPPAFVCVDGPKIACTGGKKTDADSANHHQTNVDAHLRGHEEDQAWEERASGP